MIFQSASVGCQTDLSHPELTLEELNLSATINKKKKQLKNNIKEAMKEEENKKRQNYCDICLWKEHKEIDPHFLFFYSPLTIICPDHGPVGLCQ